MDVEEKRIGGVKRVELFEVVGDEECDGRVVIESTLSFLNDKVPGVTNVMIVSAQVGPLAVGADKSLIRGQTVSARHYPGRCVTNAGSWTFEGESFKNIKPWGVKGDYIYTGGMLIGRIVMRVWDKAFDPEGRTSSVLVQFRERDQKNLVQLHEWEFRPLTEQEKADTGLPVEAYDSLGYPTLTVVRKW